MDEANFNGNHDGGLGAVWERWIIGGLFAATITALFGYVQTNNLSHERHIEALERNYDKLYVVVERNNGRLSVLETQVSQLYEAQRDLKEMLRDHRNATEESRKR